MITPCFAFTITHDPRYIVPTVYRVDAGGVKTAVPAQVEMEDTHVSQYTETLHTIPALTNAVYFYAVVPPLGTAGKLLF
jgi:hypothetical protein